MSSAEYGDAGEELRLLVLALLDRFEPKVRSVLAGLQVEAAEAAEAAAATETAGHAAREPAACQWCPVCALIDVLRGDRPELGGRIAEQAGALLTGLRTALERPGDGC